MLLQSCAGSREIAKFLFVCFQSILGKFLSKMTQKQAQEIIPYSFPILDREWEFQSSVL